MCNVTTKFMEYRFSFSLQWHGHCNGTDAIKVSRFCRKIVIANILQDLVLDES